MNRRTFLKTSGATAAVIAGRQLLAQSTPSQSRGALAADVVVIGAGAFGGWTALYLREMGLSVTMVDQYGPGNSRATSGGESRQIRAGYGDRELYTRWVLEAFDRWKAREGCVAVAQAFEQKGGRFLIAKADLGQRTGGTLRDIALSTGQSIAAQTFVFACGPWLPKVFPAVMKKKLTTPRRVVFFYGTPPGDERFTFPNFPTWAVDDAYGFPSIEGKGFKVVPTFDAVMVDPDTQEHTLTAEEVRKGREFVAKWFPALKDQPLVDSKVCQREDSIDEHFIVDRHPEFENVWLVGGGSGHGYKHGIVLGDYVANRITGKDKHPELAATFKLKEQSF